MIPIFYIIKAYIIPRVHLLLCSYHEYSLFQIEGPQLLQHGFKDVIAKVGLTKFISDLFWVGMFYHLYNQVLVQLCDLLPFINAYVPLIKNFPLLKKEKTIMWISMCLNDNDVNFPIEEKKDYYMSFHIKYPSQWSEDV